MKNLITLAGIILIVLGHGACRTSKNVNRLKDRMAFTEQSDIKSRVQEVNHYNHSKSLIDSNGQNYQLTIFSVDTFEFSMQNGFIGKASKVIVKATSTQLFRVSDTSTFAGSVTSELEGNMKRDLTAKMENRATSVERRGVIWAGMCIGLIVGLVILGMWRKLQKSES